jgi:2,4-dichlorophenol 6-monooxygenase
MGSGVQEQIDEQADHFDMTGLDLGFGYESAAVVADDTPPPEVVNEVTDVPTSTRPGQRLPHAPIDREGTTGSTLDLVDTSGFVLLVGSDHSTWDDAPVPVVEVQGTDDTWSTIRGIADDGAILVRPDGHVAWRSSSARTDGAAIVGNIVSRILAI